MSRGDLIFLVWFAIGAGLNVSMGHYGWAAFNALFMLTIATDAICHAIATRPATDKQEPSA